MEWLHVEEKEEEKKKTKKGEKKLVFSFQPSVIRRE
jgi:hypothetical protein